ncbi:PAS domain-containing sensor histidine kinase [Flavobacterium aquidurense]|uniref:histidine kinase n=1 Tax=Flavobacterium aquidurense TaxID=362413 RepID=A0A0Q0SBM4_9FLAO|nr:PAS domain-containing sensor histidine kinase [Flavobacterium aquidurense]KQB42525.1 PAS/PAC sensor signal transduction histidine kinase [Flavobacterium aquidurense]
MYQNPNLLQNIIDSIPLPIGVYVGDNLKIELANAAMIKTYGKGDNVLGKSYFEIVPEIEKQQIFEQALNVLKTGTAFHAIGKKVDLVIQGIMTEHYFNYSFIPLFDDQGKVYGVLNTGADVTDFQLAKQEVQNSNERLKMAIESSGIGSYEIDLATKKIKTSGNFNAICSIESEATSEDLIAKLDPDDLPAREKAHEEAKTTGRISYEARIVNTDKSARWTKINGKIINDEDGNPKTIIGIIQDIHEQREFEEELKKQVSSRTDELIRSNNDLMHFASVVSHDLREPVRKIKIFNTLLRNDIEDNVNEKSKKYLHKVSQSAQRMENIIEGILTYSTLDKTLQHIETIDLNEIIENIKIDLELIIKEKDAILVTCDLPEIEGAPILINQLFYNLLQNALKFSKADQPPRVIITCTAENIDGVDSLKITIKDNGIGLDSEFAERIFTAFERLHSKSEYEGNGLGLALCRKIAKRHSGTITAAGEKDNGAEFIVTLPLKQTANTI